jgi:hypothetical protein
MNREATIREAEHYLWHLDDPCFDHEHWWKGKENKIPIVAVVWEIIRRHPNAARVHEKRNLAEMNFLGISIRAHGFCSWPKLTLKQKSDIQKRIWKHLPSQHGYVVPPVTVLNDMRPLMRYLKSEKGGKKLMALQEPYLNRRLCDETLSSHRSGQIIVAIDPGAQSWRVIESVKAAVENWRGKVKMPTGGKARNDQRLVVITNFEKEELSRKLSKTNRNADLFTRYRRIIGSFNPPLLTETPDD